MNAQKKLSIVRENIIIAAAAGKVEHCNDFCSRLSVEPTSTGHSQVPTGGGT